MTSSTQKRQDKRNALNDLRFEGCYPKISTTKRILRGIYNQISIWKELWIRTTNPWILPGDGIYVFYLISRFQLMWHNDELIVFRLNTTSLIFSYNRVIFLPFVSQNNQNYIISWFQTATTIDFSYFLVNISRIYVRNYTRCVNLEKIREGGRFDN